jgi:hypothetical protein
MIAICLPLAIAVPPQRAGGRSVTGLAIGFTCSIFEGISLTMARPEW